MNTNGEYKFLKPKRGSRYRQLFCGRIRAEVLYRETVGTEPLTARVPEALPPSTPPRGGRGVRAEA